MNCMKCGTEIKEPEVFCEKCRAEMEKYPVKPNISIQLPRRIQTAPVKKKTKKQRYAKPEDQIRYLKTKHRWMTLTLVVALLAFGLLSVLMLRLLEDKDTGFGIGQNYGTMASTEST